MKILITAVGLCLAASLSSAQTVPTLKTSPATVSLRAGASATQTFKVTETGVKTPSTTFTWTLSGAAAANLGAISSTGVYTPPAVPPVPNTVTVTATDTANKLAGTATITVLDPVPVITSLSTYNVNTALPYTLDIKGTGFLPSDVAMFDTTAMKSTFISSTDIQIHSTSTAAAGTKIAVTVVDPKTAAGGKTSNATTLNVLAPVSVTASPDGRTIRCGVTTPLQLAAHVNNNSDQTVTWQVNGMATGNSTIGTISSTGAYTPPATLPGGVAASSITGSGTTTLTPVTVKITATSKADPTASSSVTVTLQNPTPAISSVAPGPVLVSSLKPAPTLLTISGTGFAQGATIYFAGVAQPTTWVSNTKLTASFNPNFPVGGRAAVKVSNPNPGALTSAPVTVPVQLQETTLMSYSDAVRFLEMATFGPTPASIAHLQAIGRDAWLAEQFSAPPSVWPDPLSDSEGMSRLQNSFFNIALTGSDQLRQRVSFALAQIMVASGAKDTQFSQMVGYQRLLGDSAFGTFRDLLGKMTLNPAMGYYLDMVNNDKANPRKNTVANENYAREVMQLFTIGLVQLNDDGTPATTLTPEYSQATVTDMAKVMTGWTYSPAPGYASQWPNPPYYFQPMVPFDAHHDQTAKNISLPLPCTIGAGGTAQSDLTVALNCLANQPTMAPFISYRLIQRLVKSEPSPAYLKAVADTFKNTNGNLQAVVAAILTNQEALSPAGTGKLAEPILYATNLLRALNVTVTDGAGLNSQTTAMGQNALEPSSVFSYFSPFYRTMGHPAPEFQGVNAATGLARANFAWRAVTNGISGTIRVDFSNLQDIVTVDPAAFVESVNQALYRGAMTNDEKSILLAAAKGSTSSLANVRSTIYAAAAAPQYQVQQ